MYIITIKLQHLTPSFFSRFRSNLESTISLAKPHRIMKKTYKKTHSNNIHHLPFKCTFFGEQKMDPGSLLLASFPAFSSSSSSLSMLLGSDRFWWALRLLRYTLK
ncbi:hypothetical protein HanIR_Chr13g0669751 [Helianthus annuus]|nr:hypothetical protein HanIR_Chr13g0669751 [Helianthus annuus]